MNSEHSPELPFQAFSTQQEIVRVRCVLMYWKYSGLLYGDRGDRQTLVADAYVYSWLVEQTVQQVG